MRLKPVITVAASCLISAAASTSMDEVVDDQYWFVDDHKIKPQREPEVRLAGVRWESRHRSWIPELIETIEDL